MSLLNDHHHRPRMPSPQPSYARHMTAAINIPSGRGSPIPTSAYRNGSLQSTPEGMIPFASSSLPAVPSYTLPEALLGPPPTSSPSAMAEALGKGPGLIRRVSRGAQGIPNRFRRGQSAAQRDKSSGPVIMRRRSDSRTAVDGDTGLSDFDTFEEEDAVDDFFGEPPASGLGITSTPHTVSSIPDHRVVAPVRNARLEQGTVLKKVTRKDKKDINLRLDLESAKVFWDPSKPSKAFYIDDVKEIRAGFEAKHYREECGVSENYAPYWFTIVYTDTTRIKGRIRTMHLIAPDVGIFNMWTHTLESVSRNRIDMMASLLSVADKSARLVWQRAMNKRDNNEESLDFRGIVELCRNLHINCTEATIRDHFSKADTTSSGKLNKAQFLAFVARLKERRDVKAIFKSLTGGFKEMDRPTFDSFLLQEQGVDVTEDPEYWMNMFEKYARSTRSKATPIEGGEIPLPLTMNFSAFQSFLASSANSVLKAVGTAPRLDRPLNEYFISSSHNTYLLGRQVAGESSTEAYITALQKGCRCVEIDCWDGNDDKPVVMHGRTLTKSISFLDTIKAINRYAFTASPYPLILSLEVHCSAPQQIIMVELMRKEFGEKLVCQPLDFDSFALPTPEELKHKILIKVKGASDNQLDSRALMNELSSKRTRSFSSPWSRPVQLNDNIIPNSPLLSSPPSMSPPERTGAFWATPRTSTTSTNITAPTPIASSAVVSSAEDSDSPHVTAAEGPMKQPKKAKTSNITKELGVLGVYTRGVKFTDFNCTDANTFNHVFSINERAFEKITKPGAKDKHLLEEHNIRCLMRVYPHAFRINSSNFDPLKFWRRGVQMVALNWQTYDLGQQLNEAMFASGNDRTGYVLKPSALRHGMHSSSFGHVKAPKKEVKFTVQIISAQQLPRPRGLGPDANINPYVEFEMYCAEDVGANATGIGGQDASAPNGHSGIGNPLRKRTRIVEGNGYNPEFGNEIEMKVTTRYPSLVFVRWTVWNSLDARTTNHAPLAIFTAKLNSIQQGFRHLPLYDSNGEQYLFSTLFCKIKKKDIIDAPEAPPQRTGSRRSSFGAASPLLEPMNSKASRNFVKRLISRAPSERRRRQDERTGSESRESDLDFISRASTLER